MRKPMVIMLICIALLLGLIFGIKAIQGHLMMEYMSAQGAPVITVSDTVVQYDTWQPKITASGSLRAVRGVDVTTEISGLIRTILFVSGSVVNQGDVLVALNADADEAHLHSLQALAEVAQTTYDRDKAQFAIQAVSKATLDADSGDLKSRQAQVAEQTAIVAKKTIRAPFQGRLGISAVNPGQYLNPGDKIVTLQSLDPIYVDFYIPQQALAEIAKGQAVTITTDTYPGKVFTGKVSTINPKVDSATRNVAVEATISNKDSLLLPGMFASVKVKTGTLQRYLTLPQTAISYNSYGDLVYVVAEQKKTADKKTPPQWIVKQQFVETGDTRGDQVAVLKGIKAGDRIVTSGQLKLKNGSTVIINNTVLPSNNPAPNPPNEG